MSKSIKHISVIDVADLSVLQKPNQFWVEARTSVRVPTL